MLIEEISVPERRQRKRQTEISGLASSISRLGLLHPIVITRENMLVAGFRRLQACKFLGWTSIPHTFTDELNPLQLHLIELEENMEREDLTPQEYHEAIVAYIALKKELNPGITREEIATDRGLSPRVLYEHETIELKKDHPAVVEALKTSATTAFRTAKRIVDREDADKFGVYSGATPLYTPYSIIQADFHSWSATYDGPKFNLIHCDFPYGIDSHISGQNPSGYMDSADVYWNLIRTLSLHLDAFCADSAHMLFWFSPKHYCATWELLKLLDGFTFDDAPLVWVRDDQRGIAPDPQRRPRRVYEMAFFGWRNDRPLIRMKNNAFVGSSPSGDHAHEKSTDALVYFFEMVCDGNTTIFDPTCGSGSAIKAARSLGAARGLGLEINGDFVNDALRSLAAIPNGSRNGLGREQGPDLA